MQKIPKRGFTAEFKQQAVQRIGNGHSVTVVARELGVTPQTLRNWAKALAPDELEALKGKPVTAEQMEMSRLRAENKRLSLELEIAKKAAAYFAKNLL
jgi:transposase